MKSRILGKLIVMCLLVLGMVLILGAKAMVSANPLYYRSAQNPVLMAQFLPWTPIYPIPPWPPSFLLVQPKLPSKPSVSEDLSGMGATFLPLVPFFFENRGDNDVIKKLNELKKVERVAQLPMSYYYTFIDKPFPVLENEPSIPLPNICDLEMAVNESRHIADNTDDESQMVAKGLTGVNVFRHKNLKNESVIEEHKGDQPMVLAALGLIPFF